MLLKSINRYRSTRKLTSHKSLTVYQKWHVSSNNGKKRKKLTEYTRATSTDYSEPVRKLVAQLSEVSGKYLKHRTYFGNSNCTFPLLKKDDFVELGFAQNLSLRFKDELWKVLFSGRQFTLCFCWTTEMHYHYHLNHDT